jgi:hypothetical protein
MFAPDGRSRIDHGARCQGGELDTTIRRELTDMCDGLRHAANCPVPSHIVRVAKSGSSAERSQAATRMIHIGLCLSDCHSLGARHFKREVD